MRTIIRNNYDPKNGDYHETIIIDDERNKKYVFDCDGVFTDFTNPRVVSTRGTSEDFAASQKWVTEIDDKVDGLAEDLGDEIQARTDADDAIWAEIEEIEMSSDVVDIVGTYAELQQYDTSKLHNNDIIKVLRDETHQNETAYYRFSTSASTFSYVGSEGPYYTESEVDALLAGKQDNLIAGANIQIAADGKTISATDTTYTHFTGATASTDGVQGLVPGPLAGDQDKVLKGDGTWGDAAAITTFYLSSFTLPPDNNVALYKDAACTSKASVVDVLDALEKGQVYLCSPDMTGDYLNYFSVTGYSADKIASSTYSVDIVIEGIFNEAVWMDSKPLVYELTFIGQTSSADTFSLTDCTPLTSIPTASSSTLGGIKVGSNLSITSGILSAKPMVGATSSSNGVEGYVPQPLIADKDKFLKGDGTWAAVQSGSPINVVQTKGASTEDVMSQNAVTRMVYKDSGYQHIALGRDAGTGSNANANYIAIGALSSATGASSVALGNNADASGIYSFALSGSSATDRGEIAVGLRDPYGYNFSNYRLLTGLYDPQDAHDAATKGYVDTAVAPNNISSNDWSALWQ